jgi:hypothetical protein
MLFEILRFAQNDIFATCHSEGAKRLKNLGEQRFRNIIETCLDAGEKWGIDYRE